MHQNIANEAYAKQQAYERSQRGPETPQPKTQSEMEEQLSLLMSMSDEMEKVVCRLRERMEPVLNLTNGEGGTGSPNAPEPCLCPVASQLRSIRQQIERTSANASSLIGSLAI